MGALLVDSWHYFFQKCDLSVCRLSVDNITEEVKNLKSKLKELEKAMKNGPKDVSKQFSDFVTVSLSSFCLWVTG